MQWIVEYEVDGFPGVQKRGPYNDADVDYHVNDIGGFEGVTNCHKVPVQGGSVEEKSNGER